MSATDDPILKSLADLPEVPHDATAADDVRRRARLVLVGEEPAPSPFLGRLSFAWSNAILPAILLGSGAAYAVNAVRMMGQIFLS